ncbi:MAG: hypothetical protein K2Y37_20870 [Pirellulales bacterium]|nr:hypothetical protein [Pirellulales bacterium]
MSTIAKSIAFAVFSATLVPNLCFGTTYSVTDLGLVNPSWGITRPTGINNGGQVIGDFRSPAPHPRLYSGGTMLDMGMIGGFFQTGYANGINNGGLVVGTTTSGHAFLYSGGTVHDLGLGSANSINDAGDIVGSALFQDGSQLVGHAARFDVHGTDDADDLGTLPGYEGGSWAVAINGNGQIIGTSAQPDPGGHAHAFLYDGGAMQDLGTLGGDNSYAYGLNNGGQIVGTSTATDGLYHAFVYSGGGMLDIGSLLGPDFESWAYGINNEGDIVGRYTGYNSQSGQSGPILYSGGALIDLNSLIVTPGYSLSEAIAINDAGQIVGVGVSPTKAGVRTLLLTPVPEPSTFVLGMLAAAGCLLGIGRANHRSVSQ